MSITFAGLFCVQNQSINGLIIMLTKKFDDIVSEFTGLSLCLMAQLASIWFNSLCQGLFPGQAPNAMN